MKIYFELVFIAIWILGLVHIVRNKRIETPEKIGWFIFCVIGSFLGLFLYTFFREDIMRSLNSNYTSMSHEKKLELEDKWKN